jgi:hypothetical protein
MLANKNSKRYSSILPRILKIKSRFLITTKGVLISVLKIEIGGKKIFLLDKKTYLLAKG